MVKILYEIVSDTVAAPLRELDDGTIVTAQHYAADLLDQLIGVRIPTKPAMHSKMKLATNFNPKFGRSSDLKPASRRSKSEERQQLLK